MWFEGIIIRDQDLIVSSYSSQQLKTFLNSSKPYSTPVSFPFADVRANPSPEVNLEKQYRLLYPALLPKSLSADLQEENVEKYVYYVTNHGWDHSKNTSDSSAVSLITQEATLEKLPGFSFSRYNYQKSTPTAIVSKSTFQEMLPSPSLAKDKMIVKLKPTVSQREYAYVVDSTRSIVQEDSGASLLERKPLVNSIDDAQLALDIYFYILSVLCCILLFFATSVSLK